MHRLLMGPPCGMVVDHINGNGLDNTRRNLRIATHRQNSRNQRPQAGKSSPFKGVWEDPSPRNRKPWRAAIRIDGRLRYLGRFHEQEEAARAYAAAAEEHFGRFACISREKI